MKLIIQLSFFLFSSILNGAMAKNFVIEEDMPGLPYAVDAAIRNSKGFELISCRLIGTPINLSGKGNDSGFVATTAEGCAWGAAAGPIWVVRNDLQPEMVLAYTGYSLSLGEESQNGFYNITISAATAGWSSESFWKFDGVRYVKVEEISGGTYH